MRIKYSYLSAADSSNRFVDLGVMIRFGKRLKWAPAEGRDLSTHSIGEAAKDATLSGAAEVSNFWEYWIERGWGGRSSTTPEKMIKAKSMDAAAKVLLSRIDKVQS